LCLQKRTSNSRNMTGDNAEKRINGGDKTAAEFWYWCLSERRSSRYRETSVPGMLNVHPHHALFSVEIARWPIVKLLANPHSAWIEFDIEGIAFGIGMQLHFSFCLTDLAATSVWKTRRTSTLSSRTRYGMM